MIAESEKAQPCDDYEEPEDSGVPEDADMDYVLACLRIEDMKHQDTGEIIRSLYSEDAVVFENALSLTERYINVGNRQAYDGLSIIT